MDDLVNAFIITLETGLFWHEVIHVVLILPICYLVFRKTKNMKLSLLPLVFAFFPDIDHYFNYLKFYGFGFSFSRFVTMDYFRQTGVAILPFHAWEWVIIALPFSIKKGWKSIITPLLLGYTVHLVWDAFNVGSFWFYSIIYRYFLGFRLFM